MEIVQYNYVKDWNNINLKQLIYLKNVFLSYYNYNVDIVNSLNKTENDNIKQFLNDLNTFIMLSPPIILLMKEDLIKTFNEKTVKNNLEFLSNALYILGENKKILIALEKTTDISKLHQYDKINKDKEDFLNIELNLKRSDIYNVIIKLNLMFEEDTDEIKEKYLYFLPILDTLYESFETIDKIKFENNYKKYYEEIKNI